MRGDLYVVDSGLLAVFEIAQRAGSGWPCKKYAQAAVKGRCVSTASSDYAVLGILNVDTSLDVPWSRFGTD